MDSNDELSTKRGSYYKYTQSGYNTKLPYAARPRKRKIVNIISKVSIIELFLNARTH